MSEVAIYALCDPETGERRYVGKTNDIQARLRGHMNDARGRRFNTRKDNWIRSLGGREPKVEVLEVTPRHVWAQQEQMWIIECRAFGARLTNANEGGQANWMEGRKHSEETKAKLRAAHILRGSRPPSQLGIKASEETRARLSATRKRLGTVPPPMGGWNKGRKMSAEAVENNRASHVGRPWSDARRARGCALGEYARSQKGKKLSAEHVEKIRLSAISRWSDPAQRESARNRWHKPAEMS